ncbi:hypothetical protein B0J17DRAFT_302312 [Rhizoctonia solani]|nr:hypothetical protein B0J17DRAFT_302312 [Rhizoctonia solani]
MTESNCISYPTIKLWEETGASLLIAIKSYMDLCLNLGTQSLREGILAEDLTARIDYTLGAIHLPMSRQLAASSAALAQSRNNLASPFHRLPAEVMFEIFMAVVYDATDKEIINPPYMEQDVLVIYRRLYNLLGTCSTWKDIIINRGALWLVIPMTRNPRTHKQGPFRLSLERSTGNKLHLAVNPWISTTSSDLNEVLTKYLPRFHSINLEAVNHHEATATIEKLLQSDTHESLSKLSIGVYMGYSIIDSIPRESDHIISRNHPQHALFQRLLERLTAIHISGAIIRWDTLTFSTRLNELRIERVALGYDDQIIPFLQTLSSASELRDLKIVSVVTFRRSPTTTPNMKRTSLTWFPRLRSLLIQDVYLNTLEFLLPTISHGSHHLVLFLSDKSLQIKSLEDNDNNDDETEGSEDWSPKLVNLCEILEPVSVDTLMISGHGTWGGMWLTGTMFRRLLQSMPTIKT